jgi:hypothetical protein
MRTLAAMCGTFLVISLLAACMDHAPPTVPILDEVGATAPDDLAPTLSAHAQPTRSTSEIRTWPPPGMLVEGGEATLLRNHRGLSLTWKSPVEHRGTYTLWWVIWNDPSLCAEPGACGLPDLFVDGDPAMGPNPLVTVMSAGGHVVGGSRRANFGATLRVGEITPLHPAFPDSPGLSDPANAEVHVVLQDHGELVPSEMPDQIKIFQGGCEASERECADVQFAVFK